MIKSFDSYSSEYLHEVKNLFLEYASTLGFGLDFQDFKKEFDELPGEYSPPDGCILIA